MPKNTNKSIVPKMLRDINDKVSRLSGGVGTGTASKIYKAIDIAGAAVNRGSDAGITVLDLASQATGGNRNVKEASSFVKQLQRTTNGLVRDAKVLLRPWR